MSQQNNLEKIKDWFVFIVAVVTCVAGVIFWVQSSNDPKFDKLESQINVLRSDIENIRKHNSEILRIVGRLEGKLENKN